MSKLKKPSLSLMVERVYIITFYICKLIGVYTVKVCVLTMARAETPKSETKFGKRKEVFCRSNIPTITVIKGNIEIKLV